MDASNSTPVTPNAKTVPANTLHHKQRPPLQPGTYTLSQRKLVFIDPAAQPDLPGLELPVPAYPSPTAAADAALDALGSITST
jgi:hypothetical protein